MNELDFTPKLQDAFEAAYRRLYKCSLDTEAEVTAWTVRVHQPRPARPVQEEVAIEHQAVPIGSRPVFEGGIGAWQDWPVFDRQRLAPGAMGFGPAILQEAEKTTIVPPNFRFAIDMFRFIRLTRENLP